MAIDYGDVRIGIAQSDLMQVIASPLDVIANTGLESSAKKIADLAKANEQLRASRAQETSLLEKIVDWKKKDRENNQKMEENQMNYHKQQSRLESLKNIAERYDGYGNSIRKVMEQKSQNAGLLGVVDRKSVV